MRHVVCTAIKRLNNPNDVNKLTQWQSLEDKLVRLEIQLKHNRALAFAFVEGALVRALRQGKCFIKLYSLLKRYGFITLYLQVIGFYWMK